MKDDLNEAALKFPGVPLKIAGRRPAIFQKHFLKEARGWRPEAVRLLLKK